MTNPVVRKPMYTHTALKVVEFPAGVFRAPCSCGAYWTDGAKKVAMRRLHKHISECAKAFRQVRNEHRRKAVSA